ncbi:larval cuticle protein LCP-17-like isoform X2 [Choristoneura fumiferana]|uniref:larval cuticle protein LCP-17-like isoform X2 n=1 Tax=Choristoneura fumiferana TaxID=7141 RepID=UPI003D15D756
MKLFLISCLVALAAADVSHIVKSADAGAQIVRQDVDVAPDQYQYAYETSNGISADEQGQLKGTGEAAISAQGQYRYTSPEGETYNIQYVADENGFQPQGAHLPTPPPIPEAIIRSLEYNRAHPEQPSKP